MSDDTQPAMTYPTEAQYGQWKNHAEELDMSVSEFMQSMIEAGRKKFTVDVTPDETARELRQQRNDLKEELAHTRRRVRDLEEQLHRGERVAIQEYIEENPGATYDEIVQHVMDTVPSRVVHHLDDLVGETVTESDETYYPVERDE